MNLGAYCLGASGQLSLLGETELTGVNYVNLGSQS